MLRPKRLSLDSSIIVVPSVNVSCVINIDAECGIRYLLITHSLLAPIALTASTNWLDIIPITVPLTSLATIGDPAIPIAIEAIKDP